MSLQVPPVQHVYPAQVQYVEGGDAVYANGAMYVPSRHPPPCPSEPLEHLSV